MINSMTGFGRGEASAKGISVTVEIKSVNSRYLDISFRIPQSIQDKELALKEIIQDNIQRGNINITVRVDKADTGVPEITFNENLVKGYSDMLKELQATAGIDQPITLETLMDFNNIFESRDHDPDTIEKIWELTQKSTKAACDKLVEMRRQEGTQLENDLRKRIDHIDKMLSTIKEKINGRPAEIKQDLIERISDLIDSDKIDEERLEMEVAILVDKQDITEEIVRTLSHIKFFREALDSEDPVGRRLNFLSQEINREINTIGSKANDSEISQYVVEAKESLEQIREQIQNVE